LILINLNVPLPLNLLALYHARTSAPQLRYPLNVIKLDEAGRLKVNLARDLIAWTAFLISFLGFSGFFFFFFGLAVAPLLHWSANKLPSFRSP